MRGVDVSQPKLFITNTVEDFVPKKHPLRALRVLVDEALGELNGLFDEIYADEGRDSVAPERLMRASLLQVLYSLRSERQLVEHIRYNMLYRWFVGLELDDRVWHASTFCKNRQRLLGNEVFAHFFETVLGMARKRGLLSEEHFSVDGTLIDAWASHKSFRRKDDDGDGPLGKERDYRGEVRCNETHASTTDADAELMRKSGATAARLSYGVVHVMENRHGLVVGVRTHRAGSETEREAGLALLAGLAGTQRKTVGGDRGFDTQGFVAGCRESKITPHVAMNENRRGGTALDGRTTRHEGYEVSLVKRKLIETTFAWSKQYGGMRRMMLRGLEKVEGLAIFTMAAFNLLRIRNLEAKGTA